PRCPGRATDWPARAVREAPWLPASHRTRSNVRRSRCKFLESRGWTACHFRCCRRPQRGPYQSRISFLSLADRIKPGVRGIRPIRRVLPKFDSATVIAKTGGIYGEPSSTRRILLSSYVNAGTDAAIAGRLRG